MTRLTELKQGQLCLNILILTMQIEAGMDQFYCHCNKTDKLKKANQGWFRQYDLISNNRDFFTAFSEKNCLSLAFYPHQKIYFYINSIQLLYQLYSISFQQLQHDKQVHIADPWNTCLATHLHIKFHCQSKHYLNFHFGSFILIYVVAKWHCNYQ